VLIRKHYPEKVKKRRAFWKLERMPIEVAYNPHKKQIESEAKDMEELREELEQDKKMRKKINIYLVTIKKIMYVLIVFLG
jgi:hypothetical protein